MVECAVGHPPEAGTNHVTALGIRGQELAGCPTRSIKVATVSGLRTPGDAAGCEDDCVCP